MPNFMGEYAMNERQLNAACARADARTRATVEHNDRLRAVFDAFRATLDSIGQPDVLMVEGFDWRDIHAMLRDMTPDTSDAAREAVYDRYLEREVTSL